MAATALEHHGHLAFVIQGVGHPRTNQWFVVCRQAAGKAWEQGRVVRLCVGRFLGVVGIVEADTDDLARLAHQRQVVLLTNLDSAALGRRPMAGEIHATRQQRFQRFLAQHLDAFRGTHAEHSTALMIERHITHGS
ncbi:hypothetical protein D3C84_623830 [compost metagenome]